MVCCGRANDSELKLNVSLKSDLIREIFSWVIGFIA